MKNVYMSLKQVFRPRVDYKPPALTTEEIHTNIEKLREQDAEHDRHIEERDAQIIEVLSLFPIGIPATPLEISKSIGGVDLPVSSVLIKLARDENSGWERVMVNGCRHYQKVF